jgi:hypothetical protein
MVAHTETIMTAPTSSPQTTMNRPGSNGDSLVEFGIKIAPSTYYAARSRPRSRRTVRGEELMAEIRRVYDENYRVYGARKSGANSHEKVSRLGAAGSNG